MKVLKYKKKENFIHVEKWETLPSWAQITSKALLEAMRERDPYTFGHCLRVGWLAQKLAQAAGLSEYEQTVAYQGGVFHDLGKLGIPDSILLKPCALTKDEQAIMQTHPIKSIEIVSPLGAFPFFRATFPSIRHHHERIDGQGYPDRISGENIPLLARLMVIVDSFDAMTTMRPYLAQSMSHEMACQELKTFAGRQFDKNLVQVFLKAYPHWPTFEQEITESFIARHYKRAA